MLLSTGLYLQPHAGMLPVANGLRICFNVRMKTYDESSFLFLRKIMFLEVRTYFLTRIVLFFEFHFKICITTL